jgi:uncharacterized protein YjiS (DUF1127 family)
MACRPHCNPKEDIMSASSGLLRAGSSGRSRSRVGTFLKAAWRAYWQERAQRATAELLHRLDDSALSDIGIARNEIDCVVYGDAPNCCRR